MLKDFEQKWLKDKIGLDTNNVVIPDESYIKGITFNLYSDKFSTDLNAGWNFAYKAFSSYENDEMWNKYFDMIIPDYENNTFYFYYFINSKTEPNYKNSLKFKLTNLVNNLIPKLYDDKEENNIWYRTFKHNSNVRGIVEDFINEENPSKEILIYDLGDKFENDDIDFLENNVKLEGYNISFLKNQLYKNKVQEASDYLKNTELGDTKFEFNYNDPNTTQTEDGANRNFIKYNSVHNTENYIFSFSGKSIVDAYKRYEEGLLERNIRYGLSEGKEVNNGIKETINETPEDFWILNNGLTIVAENIKIDEVNKKVTLTGFNIVNGAQTITNLWKSTKSTEKQDLLKKIFVPTKILIVSRGYTEESLNKQIARITTSANNQKAVKPRDLVSNDKNMKELKEEFKKSDIILNIKRGDENFADAKDKEDIIKIRGNISVETVKNLEVGQEIISLIMQNPAKALQIKNKIFMKENYDKIFKNKNISNENIVSIHIFRTKIENLMKKFINNKNVSFSNLASLDLNLPDNMIDQLESNLFDIYNKTSIWFISMLYYVVYLNQDQDKNLISINKINKDERSKFDPSLPMFSSLFLINDSDKLDVTDYPNTDFKKSFIKLLENSIILLNNIYQDSLKEKPRSTSAFSFTDKFYKDYLSKMIQQNDLEFIPLLKQIL